MSGLIRSMNQIPDCSKPHCSAKKKFHRHREQTRRLAQRIRKSHIEATDAKIPGF